MRAVWGIGSALLLGAAGAYVMTPATANLPLWLRLPTLALVVVAIGLTAFLCATAVAGRAGLPGGQPRQFMAAAFVLGGAVMGGVTAGALTFAYLVAYGTMPADPILAVLYVAATPVLAFAGAVAGGIGGLIAASILGTMLRVVSPAWR